MCEDESPLAIHHLEGRNAVPQGADWDINLLYAENDVASDFSSYTGRMQIRTDYDGDIIMELSTDDGTIVLAAGAFPTTPNVTLKFLSGTTAALTKYKGIYDLELISSTGLVKKFLEGRFELRKEVTK